MSRLFQNFNLLRSHYLILRFYHYVFFGGNSVPLWLKSSYAFPEGVYHSLSWGGFTYGSPWGFIVVSREMVQFCLVYGNLLWSMKYLFMYDLLHKNKVNCTCTVTWYRGVLVSPSTVLKETSFLRNSRIYKLFKHLRLYFNPQTHWNMSLENL